MGAPRSDQTRAIGNRDRLGPIRHVQFQIEVFQVELDGPFRRGKNPPDLPGG